ncbi:S66 peptidase family protein [Ichthyenterobacterium magnum]|uniref:Muramoyltetrapeptide carboxypeptidase n=1 Tax=Ichthyenterobacterium magnum TaxID=1230530 RepID=A0A420DXR1_9FLAO|nr:LD-carboxypeptidase [Ichthyenterobacterium magnum]RKE98986.1 muramoyltetrapeptide carboxypeptidase [Ichthyenterobacterium magnum]
MSKSIFILSVFIVIVFFGNINSMAQNTTSKQQEMLIQPDYLKAGDTVAIVAPSGILKERNDEVNRAKALLKSWGLNVVVGDHVFSQDNHFAGTDAERCEDFQKVLDNPKISAIWCARGGYGTVRILDKLDYTKFKQNPKWIIGYSDITAIHNQVHNEGYQSLHALMCVSLTKDLSKIQGSIDTFKSALFGSPVNYDLEYSPYNRLGEASGELVGGNLTILHTMLGSNTSIDTSGKILFIEEIGEYKYHIDRMLQSLKRAGYFNNCAGLIVGDMSKMRKNTTPWGKPIEQLVLDALADYNFPIAFGMPAGHEKDNRALVLGRKIELTVNSEQSTIKFEE